MHLSTELSTLEKIPVDKLFHVAYETDRIVLLHYNMLVQADKEPENTLRTV